MLRRPVADDDTGNEPGETHQIEEVDGEAAATQVVSFLGTFSLEQWGLEQSTSTNTHTHTDTLHAPERRDPPEKNKAAVHIVTLPPFHLQLSIAVSQ